MNPTPSPYSGMCNNDKRGEFYIGVAPDNISSDYKYTLLNIAKEKAEYLSDITGIQFHVYEQVTEYRPVS